MIPICCVGCKYAEGNQCGKQDFCLHFKSPGEYAPTCWEPPKEDGDGA